MKIAVLIILMFLTGFISNAQKVNQSFDKLVLKWVKDYYHKKNENIKDQNQVHVLLVEQHFSKKEAIAVYTIGVNISGVADMILFYNKNLDGSEKFTVVGEQDLKTNLQNLYELFDINKRFSNNAKVVCYERFVVDSQLNIKRRGS